MIIRILLIFFVLVGQCWGADTKLDHYWYIESHIYCADSTYLYGRSVSGTQLIRFNDDTDFTDTTSGHDFTGTNIIRGIWTVSSGSIFAMVEDTATNFFTLHRSTDSGSTFGSAVFTFGDGNGVASAQSSKVKLLVRGFTENTANGDLYLGEYNINSSRTAGSTNDRVRLMKSTNDGVAWSQVAEWNTTVTEHQMDHIHAVVYNDGYLYVCSGDTGNENGIYKWDLSGAWSLSDESVPGTAWTVGGTEGQRVVDLLFTDDYIFAACDTNDEDYAGIQRWDNDASMNNQVRVNSTVNTYGAHIAFYGLKTSDGTMIFSDFIDSSETPTDSQKKFWVSGNNGSSWDITGVITLGLDEVLANDHPGVALFEFNNRVYFADAGMAGKMTNDSSFTTVMDLEGDFNDKYPIILEPVFHVSTDGNNSNDGEDQANAWASLAKALMLDNICKGSRVLVHNGAYAETTILTLDFDASNNQGTASHSPTTIEGGSKGLTTVWKNGTSGAAFLNFLDEESPVRLTNLTIYNPQTDESILYIESTETATTLEVDHCTVGRVADDGGYSLVDVRAGTYKSSYNLYQRNAEQYIIRAGTTVDIKTSFDIYVNGGIRLLTAGTTLSKCINNIFLDYTNNGIVFESNTGDTPLVKNCIFDGADSTYPLNDTIGITETSIDYNSYDQSNHANVANSGGSHSLQATDPLLNTNYTLKSNSPCINAGTNTPHDGTANVTDLSGRPITNASGDIVAKGGTVDIGAYEYSKKANFIGGGFY